MAFVIRCLLTLSVAWITVGLANGQAHQHNPAHVKRPSECPRYSTGSVVAEPADRRSSNGQLKISLTIYSSIDSGGQRRYCYFDELGNLAPTLRLRPGDILLLALKNDITPSPADSTRTKTPAKVSLSKLGHSQRDPCSGVAMGPLSTNLHFHGLSVPPVCHQDDTLNTFIQPGDPPFEYRVEIPKNQPPGLYWYHPHVHGFSEEQVLGGASGALVVDGIERIDPQLQGLRERILVIRDEVLSVPPSRGDSLSNSPSKNLSLNFVPVPFPRFPRAIIKIKPSERQFWRVLNAAADTYLDLRVLYGGTPQFFTVVSLDGVPLESQGPDFAKHQPTQTSIFIPPGSRAEFILSGPPPGVAGSFETSFVNRGAGDDSNVGTPTTASPLSLHVVQDDLDLGRPLATLVPSPDDGLLTLPATSLATFPPPNAPAVAPISATRKRSLYFSESVPSPGDPNGTTQFFITEEGHAPAVFESHQKPNIIVHVGDIEDWTIENRTLESHDFHMHQIHFLVTRAVGVPWDGPAIRDTINLPAWRGLGRFPSVTLRMDFRNPAIAGTFPFHCHILQHSDGGMMGTVRVEPSP